MIVPESTNETELLQTSHGPASHAQPWPANWPKMPATAARTLSPGESVLTKAASRAPVPEAVRI